MIEIVNPLPATIFSCHFKLLQKLTGLKAPKRLMRNFYLNMPIIIMKYLRGVELNSKTKKCNIPKSGIILVIAIVVYKSYTLNETDYTADKIWSSSFCDLFFAEG